MIYTPTGKKERRWWALFAAFLACLILYGSTQGTGIPERSALQAASGAVEWVEYGRYGVKFGLSGGARSFNYASKGNALGPVENALGRKDGSAVTVLFDPSNSGGPIYSKNVYFSVYELSVAGTPVRTYDQVQAAWRSDNKVGVWVAVAMLLCSGLLAFTRSR